MFMTTILVDEAKIEANIEGKAEEANDDEVDERTSDASDEDWEDGEGKGQEPASERECCLVPVTTCTHYSFV